MIDEKRLAELKALEQSMASSPWSTSYMYGAIRHIDRNVDCDAFASEGWVTEGASPGRYDGTSLAKLRNALPELLDTLEAALRVVEMAEELCNLNPGHMANSRLLDAIKSFRQQDGKDK